jgi:hypothetical protein
MTSKTSPKPPPPEPPHGLSERSLALWHAVVPARGSSPGRCALIEEALRALDRAEEARTLLAAEGMVTKTETTGAVHLHPLAKVERENRALFARLWCGMGLDWDRDLDSRLAVR